MDGSSTADLAPTDDSGAAHEASVDVTAALEPPGQRPAGESGVAWRIRSARPEDVPAIDALVRELAVYEREPDAVEATPDDFRAALFGANPRVHCHVAEVDGPQGPEVAGMAIWYVTFSTWRGRHGL